MDAFSDPKVTELCGVWASQVGKTDCLLNMIGQRMDREPGPILMLQPTIEMAESWSKDRLTPMLRDTPALQGKVRDSRARDSGNTVRHKQFVGGHITMSGANSPASLAMRPIRDLLADEVDRYPVSAGTEGNPLKLAVTRTRAFHNAKKVYISSPTRKGVSQIEIIWKRSDQRQFHVPCPDCGVEQKLEWAQVHWECTDDGEPLPETAVYTCQQCGSCWTDEQRRAAVRRGQWVATRPFRGCAGFQVSALAAPWDSCRLEELVKQWVEARGNPELEQVFQNTVLAEWYEERSDTVDETGLMARREDFQILSGRAAVPQGAAILTAGVDIQEARVEVTVDAWGAGEECWRLAHEVLYGDPTTSSLWADLDKYLLRPWTRPNGAVEFIRATAVDTGGLHTQASYDFCGPRFRRMTPDGGSAFIFAIKGAAGAGEVWPRAASKVTHKVPLWLVRVDSAKEQIYGRLLVSQPGPGYVHFPKYLDKAYFLGLTAEQVITRTDRKGFPRRTWEKKAKGGRNEPLDCAAYSYAALCGLRAMGFDLDKELMSMSRRLVVTPEQLVEPKPAPPSPRPPRRGDNWLGVDDNWLRGY